MNEKTKSILGSFMDKEENTERKKEKIKKKVTTIHIPEDLFVQTRIKLAERRETMSGVVERYLREYVEK